MTDTSEVTPEAGTRSEIGIRLPSSNLVFDRKKRDRLQLRYNTAVTDKEAEFTFEGHGLVTAYAKYVLEYLDGQFSL